jgi:hypothetical protein
MTIDTFIIIALQYHFLSSILYYIISNYEKRKDSSEKMRDPYSFGSLLVISFPSCPTWILRLQSGIMPSPALTLHYKYQSTSTSKSKNEKYLDGSIFCSCFRVGMAPAGRAGGRALPRPSIAREARR